MRGSRLCWTSGGTSRRCRSPCSSCGLACWSPCTWPTKTPPSSSLLVSLVICETCSVPMSWLSEMLCLMVAGRLDSCMSCCLQSICVELARGGSACLVGRPTLPERPSLQPALLHAQPDANDALPVALPACPISLAHSQYKQPIKYSCCRLPHQACLLIAYFPVCVPLTGE